MSLFRRRKSKESADGSKGAKPDNRPKSLAARGRIASDDGTGGMADRLDRLGLATPNEEKRRPRSYHGREAAPRSDGAFRNSYTPAQEAAIHLNSDVPASFKACVQYLSQQAVLREAGLFRVSGNSIEVGKLSRILDEHGYFDLRGCVEPATIVALLKQRMRSEELPLKSNESKLFEMTICTSKELGMDDEMRATSTRDALVKLPAVASQTLKAIVKLLGKVHRAENMMNFSNLGTSVGIQVFPGVTAKKTGEMIEFLDAHSGVIWDGDDSSYLSPPASPLPMAVSSAPSSIRQF